MKPKILVLSSFVVLLFLGAACKPAPPLGVRGAALLEKDVKTATETMKTLADKLDDAQAKLGAKMFPGDMAIQLVGIVVPFDATNLEGKDIGHLPNRVLRSLLAFTSGAADVNKSKDKLKALFALAEYPVVNAWKDEKDPVASVAVVFRAEGDKTVADLLPIAAPFGWSGAFPESFTVTRMEGGSPTPKRVKRWVKGDLTGSAPVAIPVHPRTMAPFTSDVWLTRLSKALRELRESLRGTHDDPQREDPGLVKVGDDLVNELHKLSLSQ
jgi:hypothetical protein